MSTLATYLTTPEAVQTKIPRVRQVLLYGEEGAGPGRIVEVPAGADGEERMVSAAGSGLEGVGVG